jgi:hypothetical protein
VAGLERVRVSAPRVSITVPGAMPAPVIVCPARKVPEEALTSVTLAEAASSRPLPFTEAGTSSAGVERAPAKLSPSAW